MFFNLIVLFIILINVNNMRNNYIENQEYLRKTIDIQQEQIYNISNKEKQLNDEVYELNCKLNEVSSVDTIDTIEYSTEVKLTAYTVGDSFTPSNIMANGQYPYVGACAYNRVPIGTRLKINNNIYTVCDRALDDDVVDIYMETYNECMDFGVKYEEITILNN
jgi:3D (Asp-Asp-Asp) domain-containing protein